MRSFSFATKSAAITTHIHFSVLYFLTKKAMSSDGANVSMKVDDDEPDDW